MQELHDFRLPFVVLQLEPRTPIHGGWTHAPHDAPQQPHDDPQQHVALRPSQSILYELHDFRVPLLVLQLVLTHITK